MHGQKNIKLSSSCLSVRLSVCPSVCLCAHVENFCSLWTNFHEIFYPRIIPKSVHMILFLLLSETNNVYFTRKQKFFIIARLILLRMTYVSNWVADKTATNILSSTKFSENSDNVEEYGTARQTTDDKLTMCRKYALFIPDNLRKDTDTHSEYLTVLALPCQKWLAKDPHSYVTVHYLSYYSSHFLHMLCT